MLTNSYWRTLLGMWWLIAICIAIGMVAVFALDALQPHNALATATVRVDAPTDQNGGSTTTSPDDILATEAHVAIGDDVIALATSKSSTITAQQMKAALRVAVISGTNAFTVSASATSSDLATEIVRLDVQAFIAYENARAQQANTTREQTLQGQISAAKASLDTINQQLAALQQQGMPDTDPTVVGLKSQQAQAAANLAQLNGSLVQLQYTESLAQPAASIVQDAQPDRTSRQQIIIKNLILGGGGGLGAGIILAAYLGSRKRVRALSQLSPLAGDAVLMEVPPLPAEVLSRNLWDDTHLASIFSVLRVDLTFLGSLQNLRSLAVVGLSSGAGSSLVATLVAEQWARAGKRVLLVDTNIAAPSQHLWHNLPDSPGLSDAIGTVQSATFDLRAYLQPTARPYTMLMASGGQRTFGNRLLTSPAFALVMDALQTSDAELLVLDAPALPAGEAAIQVARRADGVILVIDKARCTVSQLEKSLKILGDADIKLAAILLNAPAQGSRQVAKPVTRRSTHNRPA